MDIPADLLQSLTSRVKTFTLAVNPHLVQNKTTVEYLGLHVEARKYLHLFGGAAAVSRLAPIEIVSAIDDSLFELHATYEGGAFALLGCDAKTVLSIALERLDVVERRYPKIDDMVKL